jgi:DNA-binding winged helix-turn-helix (wHTH) protein/TolB-like protein/Flp pilus assembly protein TadD
MSLKDRYFYEFGPYRLDTGERRLMRGDQPLPLTPKAFETLLALVENAGRAVEKDELLRRVWPDTFVEEGSLTQNISVLRKVLGDEGNRYIETVPKRGYRFAGPIQQSRFPGESLVVDEHTVTRVVTEIETTASYLPSTRLTLGIILALLVSAGVAYFLTHRVAGPPVRSLAVLPLKSVAGGTEQRYLEVGIADSIITRVSGIPGLTVRPTTAVRKYAASGGDPVEVARELRVDAVLDGTLQVAGGRVRVSLNLLRTSSGRSLWAHTFDEAWSDIFRIEDSVADRVAEQLQLQFDPGRQALAAHYSAKNPEAYMHYLKGLFSNEGVRVSSRPEIEAAIIRFRKATELDPSFARAWAQLAICYGELFNYHQPDRALADAARDAAGRAYALAPHLPELLLFRAQTFWSWRGGYQTEEAIRELRRGSGYNDATVRSLLGVIYSHAGLEAAIGEVKRAIEIDPANALHLDRLGQVYVCLGRYGEARAAFERAFEMESEERGDIAMSAIPFLYAGEYQEARHRLEKARGRSGRNVMIPANLALIGALEGKLQQAEKAIPSGTQEVEKFRNAHHAFLAYAQICALQGKSTEAVRWLRAAVDTGMPNYPMFARDPYLAGIRNSAEFIQFMADLKPRWDAIVREFQ